MAAAYALAQRAKGECRLVMIARPPKLGDFNTLAKGVYSGDHSK
jgi:hypothetical protein